MPRPWALALLLLAPAAGPAWGQAAAPVRGAEAVRAELAARGRISVVAELARSAGAAAERERLARALAPHGVAEVRGLGELPFVALEVDAAQLDALLATGGVVSVAPQRRVTID